MVWRVSVGRQQLVACWLRWGFLRYGCLGAGRGLPVPLAGIGQRWRRRGGGTGCGANRRGEPLGWSGRRWGRADRGRVGGLVVQRSARLLERVLEGGLGLLDRV